MLSFTTPKHHWNYFLALEQDLETVSRYIEFSEDNQATYSIELTHLLLSASSEIDVVLKQLCLLIDSSHSPGNINDYRAIITSSISALSSEETVIARFGIIHKPWSNWLEGNNPNWWKSYNNVKHRRDEYFREANLKNVINAIGALLIVTVYYYKYAFSKEAGHEISFMDTTRVLQPNSSFVKLNAEYYYSVLIT